MRGLHPLELIAVLFLLLDDLSAQGVYAQTLKGNDCTAAGAYTLCQNLWGADTGVGTQTTALNSAGGNAVSWETTYTWANSPNNVKSYPNVYHNTAKGMQLQDVVSAPSTWQWNYQSASNDLRADVSYDIWFGVPKTGDVASSASSYEIMIWLSSRGGVSGIGDIVAPNLKLGGHTWNLRHGPNGNWDVFSFITAEGDITDFDADLNEFFQYLVNEQGVAKTQYIQAIQAGTEPFTGSAHLVTTVFRVDVFTPDDTTSSSSVPSSTSTGKPSSTDTTSDSEPTTSGTSTTPQSPPSHTSDTSAPAETGGSATSYTGVRKAGSQQCRLQAPGGGVLVRREKLSWVRKLRFIA